MNIDLYHGTDKQSEENIMENGINVCHNRNIGDFGQGFYLSPREDIARLWALRKGYLTKPGMIKVLLKADFKRQLKVKVFEEIGKGTSPTNILEWAQFVVNNRCGTNYVENVAAKAGFSDHNLDKRYDVVIGQIADGDVVRIAKACQQQCRCVTLQEAENFLEKSFGVQYSFHTEKIFRFIEFIEPWEV